MIVGLSCRRLSLRPTPEELEEKNILHSEYFDNRNN